MHWAIYRCPTAEIEAADSQPVGVAIAGTEDEALMIARRKVPCDPPGHLWCDEFFMDDSDDEVILNLIEDLPCVVAIP